MITSIASVSVQEAARGLASLLRHWAGGPSPLSSNMPAGRRRSHSRRLFERTLTAFAETLDVPQSVS